MIAIKRRMPKRMCVALASMLALGLGLVARPDASRAQCPPRNLLYSTPVIFPLDDPATHLVIEDFDRDGVLDLASGGVGRRVTILRGHVTLDGRVAFFAPVHVVADSTPYAFAAADLNGDRIPDLAIVARDTDRLLVYLGSGRGASWNMTLASSYDTPSRPVSVAAGDFNGDGHMDLTVTNSLAYSVSTFIGRGDGTFGNRSDYMISGTPGEIAIADLNQDGVSDVALANASLSGITTMHGSGASGVGAGLLRTQVTERGATTSRSVSMQLAHLNADGVLDALISSTIGSTLGAMRGSIQQGQLRFHQQGFIPSGGFVISRDNPRGMAVADLDLDGKLDVAVGNPRAMLEKRVSVHFGDGAVGFSGPVDLTGPDQISDMEAADLDGDGSPELIAVTLEGTYAIWWGSCTGGPPSITAFEPEAGVVGDTVLVRGARLKFVTYARFNGHDAAIVGRTVSTLALRVPLGATTGPIQLVNAYGARTSTSSFIVGERPLVSSAVPDRAKAGETVTIAGRHFTGTQEVRLGGGALAEFEVVADSVLEVVVDSLARTGPIRVRTLFGTGESAFEFTFLPPDPLPRLIAIRDVPGDQGGRVSIQWSASDLDVPERGLILGYRVVRRRTFGVAPMKPTDGLRLADEVWELIETVPASGLTIYAVFATTHGDSTAAGIPFETFAVHAFTANPSELYASSPDSGYSVDNLAPPAPTGFEARTVGSTIVLRWEPSAAPDLAVYRLYRGRAASFPADSTTLIAVIDDTTHTDASPGTQPRYKLVAIDVHGNASDTAAATPDVLTPTLLSLLQRETRPGYVRLVWHDAVLAGEPGAFERAAGATNWTTIAEIVADASGRFIAEDRDAPSGTTQRYRLSGHHGADEWSSDIETVVVPEAMFALGVPWPQPVRDVVHVIVSVPRPDPATLEVVDVSGRRVARRSLILEAGERTIELREVARLPAGIYHMRLTQGSRSATRRLAVVR